PEKVNRAAPNILQPHLTNRHAPGPEPRPGTQKLARSELANQTQTLRRLHDVVPETDSDAEIVFVVRLPIQDVGENKIAAIGASVLLHYRASDLEHLGRDVDAGHMLRALLRES